jgi:hypothetical protein
MLLLSVQDRESERTPCCAQAGCDSRRGECLGGFKS